MTREEILDKIRKVKTLSESGVEGERESAANRLRLLMEKYGISEDDISEDKPEYNFTYIDDNDLCLRQIFIQIIGKVLSEPGYNIVKKSKMRAAKEIYGREVNIGAHCTKSEWLEIMFLYDEYSKDYKKQEEIFLYAYLSKNNLLIPRDDNFEPLTIEEKQKALKASMMEYGIDRKLIVKQLEGGEK